MELGKKPKAHWLQDFVLVDSIGVNMWGMYEIRDF